MTKEERRIYGRQYYLDHKEKIKESSKKTWRENLDKSRKKSRDQYWSNREKIRRQRKEKNKISPVFLKNHGLTKEDYDRMLSEQGGVCLICEGKFKSWGKNNVPLVVDHDHKTGKVRGLVCDRCNVALGLFGDNLDILIKAVEYLRKFK